MTRVQRSTNFKPDPFRVRVSSFFLVILRPGSNHPYVVLLMLLFCVSSSVTKTWWSVYFGINMQPSNSFAATLYVTDYNTGFWAWKLLSIDWLHAGYRSWSNARLISSFFFCLVTGEGWLLPKMIRYSLLDFISE